MRVRDRYERRGGSMDDVSVPPCLSDDRRSANRVVEEQVLLLRQMGFSKAHAWAYADGELQLHETLDGIGDHGREGDDPQPPGTAAAPGTPPARPSPRPPRFSVGAHPF